MPSTLARRARLVAMTLSLAALATSTGLAQKPEHPEHPKEGKAAGPALTKDQLADAIRAYVTKQAKDGWYSLQDPVQGSTLRLKLDKVHRERLARVAPDTYFACADFTSDDGVAYDLDFFMKGTDAAQLQFDDVTIHKRSGVERYRWKEAGGVWKKEPVERATSR